MKTIQIIALASLLFTNSNSFAQYTSADPAEDQDMNISGMCTNPSTDLLFSSFDRINGKYIVVMKMNGIIQKQMGYKEFYFWLDVNHDTQKGYQPYLPHSIAWPNLYADYRIFYSNETAYEREIPLTEKKAIQSCRLTDCAKDDGLRSTSHLDVKVSEDTITFEWPVGLLPDLDKKDSIKIGYTTYFIKNPCNGEDDSPQWGEDAHEVKLPRPEHSHPIRPPQPPKAD